MFPDSDNVGSLTCFFVSVCELGALTLKADLLGHRKEHLELD